MPKKKVYKHGWHYSKFSLMWGKIKIRSIFLYSRWLFLRLFYVFCAGFTLRSSCKRCSKVRIMLPFCLDGYREEPNNFYLEEWTTPHSTWDSVRGKRTSCRRVWSRGPFGELKSGPHSWIFTSVSVDPAYSLRLRSEYLFTLHQSVAQHPSDVWRSTLNIGEVQLRFHPLQKSCGEKAVRHSLQWWTTPWRITECYSMILN